MADSESIEKRVANLESTVVDLKQNMERVRADAAAARVLAGGADRDVADLKREIREFREQNTRLHNATRDDIVNLRSEMGNLRSRVEGVEGNVETLRGEMRSKFDMVAAGQQQIVGLLGQVIDRQA